jgi:hypothetical protein
MVERGEYKMAFETRLAAPLDPKVSHELSSIRRRIDRIVFEGVNQEYLKMRARGERERMQKLVWETELHESTFMGNVLALEYKLEEEGKSGEKRAEILGKVNDDLAKKPLEEVEKRLFQFLYR